MHSTIKIFDHLDIRHAGDGMLRLAQILIAQLTAKKTSANWPLREKCRLGQGVLSSFLHSPTPPSIEPSVATSTTKVIAKRTAIHDAPRALPVLKWAGGKRELLPQILPWVPKRMQTYVEPFCGGAALFFHLANERPKRFERAILGDQNAEIVALYRVLRGNASKLCEALATYPLDEAFYYRMRALDPEKLSEVERAARLVYLNKTSFNGLWRVNSKNVHNVPFGHYKKIAYQRYDRLQAAAIALQGVDIRHQSFLKSTQTVESGDFVYFDPPYFPVSTTSSFRSYGPDGFGQEEQEALRDRFVELVHRGVKVLLSNADTAESRECYTGLKQIAVSATRRINSKGDKRGSVQELLVIGEPKRRRKVTSNVENE
jgi:DNA adenine methylase